MDMGATTQLHIARAVGKQLEEVKGRELLESCSTAGGDGSILRLNDPISLIRMQE